MEAALRDRSQGEAKEPRMETEGLHTEEMENEITRQRKEVCNIRLDLAI